MSLRAILLVSLVAGPAALAGGVYRGEHPSMPTARINAKARNAPVIAQPGEGVADAAAYMAALNAPPPPPPPPPRPKPAPPPPPPPPPDVAVLFRQELSAVLAGPGAQPQAILASNGGRGRTLIPGQVYRDGWTLGSLTPSTAVLTRGAERRSIGLLSPPPTTATATAASAAPMMASGAALTNGVRQGQLTAAQVATFVQAMRDAKMNDRQITEMRTILQGDQVSAQVATRLLQQIAQAGESDPAKLTALTNILAQAGIIPQNQARQLAETLPQMQQMQQFQQAMRPGNNAPNNNNNGNNRGGGAQQGRGGGGGGGGRGGRGGFNGPPNAGFGGPVSAQPQR